jgi:predicted RND superfamily exporter protein
MDAMPVVARVEEFDARSGSGLERLIFNHRPAVVGAAALLTVLLGYAGATRHVVNADFESRLPVRHPFVRTYLETRSELRGLGNSLQVVVEGAGGDILEPGYLEALRRITDELFLMPGADRAWVKSLWMPAVRWTEVTEEGFRGGPVMPDGYDGSPAKIEELRRNVARAGLVGSLVSDDGRSSAVVVPLLDRDPATGAGIDYPALASRLEDLRRRYEGEGGGALRVRVVGFAKLVGELLEGMGQVAAWFAIAAAIVTLTLWLYTRCVRSTALVVLCSAVALVWQLGLVSALGLALDPFTMLVPFLVFAIGVSHGAQKMNGIMQDVGRGTHRLVAARYTFRRLFRAGLAALGTDAIGFAALALVEVPAMRRLAFAACAGVGALAFTNLVLLPVLLSYVGVSRGAAARSLRPAPPGSAGERTWGLLERLTGRRWALAVVIAAAAAAAAAALVRRELRYGDLGAGAPELRASSRYNRDAAFVAARYRVSPDPFAVVVRTPPEGCAEYRTLVEADRLAWELRQVPGVRTTTSLAEAVRQITAGSFEGSPKWHTLSRDQRVLDSAAHQAVTRNPDLFDADCSLVPVVAYLEDHRAETLERVVATAEQFGRGRAGPERAFLLAAGSAGLAAATNIVVREARWTMAAAVYAAVVLLCLATFRSWRAVAVTVVPLAFTSLLCEALMVLLGIGIELDTLPVLALGVGIPDYALYLLSIQLAHQRAGLPLSAAYARSLRFTGKVVALVGATLAAAVLTWAWSPLQLQADMGVLLTFMFVGNMAAALALVPALSHFLLRGEGGARA